MTHKNSPMRGDDKINYVTPLPLTHKPIETWLILCNREAQKKSPLSNLSEGDKGFATVMTADKNHGANSLWPHQTIRCPRPLNYRGPIPARENRIRKNSERISEKEEESDLLQGVSRMP